MPAPGEHHPAFEEYCECIFELREDNVEVIQARVAERLNVSRPSVSEMIKRMESEGLITLQGSKIVLTSTGEVLAERVVHDQRAVVEGVEAGEQLRAQPAVDRTECNRRGSVGDLVHGASREREG